MCYPRTSDMIPTLIDNKIIDYSDVVGTSLVGAAPTISSFSTKHLVSMDWTKTTVRRYENHFFENQVLGFDVPYTWGLPLAEACLTIVIWHCRKPLNQWRRSFQMKAALPLANRHVAGSDCSRKTRPRTMWIAWFMMTSSNGNIFRVTGPLCGNSLVTGEFPAQRPETWSFDVFFDLQRNKRLNKQCEAGDLRHYRAHYDVIVMCHFSLTMTTGIANKVNVTRSCHKLIWQKVCVWKQRCQ